MIKYVRRVAVLIVGMAVIAAGIVMLVTPGPGWAAIAIGLAILAPEFPWARRCLRIIKETFMKILRKLKIRLPSSRKSDPAGRSATPDP